MCNIGMNINCLVCRIIALLIRLQMALEILSPVLVYGLVMKIHCILKAFLCRQIGRICNPCIITDRFVTGCQDQFEHGFSYFIRQDISKPKRYLSVLVGNICISLRIFIFSVQ